MPAGLAARLPTETGSTQKAIFELPVPGWLLNLSCYLNPFTVSEICTFVIT